MFYKVDWSNAFSLVATQEGTLSQELCVRMHVAKDQKVIALQICPLSAGVAISQNRGTCQRKNLNVPDRDSNHPTQSFFKCI